RSPRFRDRGRGPNWKPFDGVVVVGGGGRRRRGRRGQQAQLVRGGGAGGAGAVPAGARAAVPRVDEGSGASGGHRVGAPLPRPGVRRPPLLDPRPAQAYVHSAGQGPDRGRVRGWRSTH
ncbi:Os03g0194400, partial [Oryza sativa Japonica Group]